MAAEMKTWYDPYASQLPVFWANWIQQFDYCYNAYAEEDKTENPVLVFIPETGKFLQ